MLHEVYCQWVYFIISMEQLHFQFYYNIGTTMGRSDSGSQQRRSEGQYQ